MPPAIQWYWGPWQTASKCPTGVVQCRTRAGSVPTRSRSNPVAQQGFLAPVANIFLISRAVQLFIEFRNMSSEGTSDMLSPARNLLSVCLENIENPCFIPSKHVFFHFFFEVFKSGVPFRHILETYSRYAKPCQKSTPDMLKGSDA